MRIAFLSWESLHSIPVGGVGVHVTELAAALERRGHEIHVFTRMGDRQAPYSCIDGVHYHRVRIRRESDFVLEINLMCNAFLGAVPPNGKIPSLCMCTDVVCVPSRNEPFGIVVLEGWAAGKPVIATQNGGPREFVSHGG